MRKAPNSWRAGVIALKSSAGLRPAGSVKGDSLPVGAASRVRYASVSVAREGEERGRVGTIRSEG